MKKTMIVLTALTLAGASLQTARAGDREWAVAGKVLTGLVAASVLTHAVAAEPVSYSAGYYVAPAPPCAYGYTYYQPAPPPQVVYVQPAPPPVVVYRAPVCVVPAPVVGLRFGWGEGYRHHHYRRGGW